MNARHSIGSHLKGREQQASHECLQAHSRQLSQMIAIACLHLLHSNVITKFLAISDKERATLTGNFEIRGYQ